jgi:ankyrin repeat protein
MAALAGLPPELILHIVSFLTRETILDKDGFLPSHKPRELELVPDLQSINSFSQTNVLLHQILDEALYKLCASGETLGQLALLSAVKQQLENAVERLVDAGVSLHTDYLFEYNPSCSLLHIAAALGLRAMVVKLLGMYGTEPMVHTRQQSYALNTTALDYAAHHEHLEIVKLLAPIPVPRSSTRNGVPPRGIIEAHTKYLSLALVQAVKVGNLQISEYLVSEGADVNFLDVSGGGPGGTPVYYAAGTKNLGLVQFFLAAGADPNLQTNNDYIPLFNATRNQNVEIVQALLAAGADIHVQNRNSLNVLGCCGTVELLLFFLERGVDPNLQDRSGETPLHRACGEEEAEFAMASVELLLQFGAAATVETASRRGLTPVDIAIAEGYTEILELLEPVVQSPDLKRKIAAWWEET